MINNTAELREMLNNKVTDNSADFDSTNRLTARERIENIFDQGTFVEIGSYVGEGAIDSLDNYGAVITGYGAINGNLAFIFSQDYSRLYGALTPSQSKKIINIIKMAVSKSAPLIGIFDSAGAKIDEGLTSIDTLTCAMKELACAKKSIYTIAAISGPCGGLQAAFASLFSFTIISKTNGTLYVSPKTALTDKTITSPEVLLKNGMVDILAENDLDACTEIKNICKLLSNCQNSDNPNRLFDTSLLSGEYNMVDVINELIDNGTFVEFQKDHAKSVITGLALINGQVTAIVATNPSAKQGKVCACGIEKASSFINKITYSKKFIPLLTLVDSKGLNYGDKPESKGYSQKLADLVEAYSEYNSRCNSSSITVVLGEAYGTVYSAFGSKSLGTGINYALDRSLIGIINPTTAVEFLGEVKDESNNSVDADNWAKENANVLTAARLGLIDDIIKDSELRQRIGASIMMMKA